MNKRTILAVLLCVAVWLIWQFFFLEPPPKKKLPDGGTPADGSTQMAAAGDKTDPGAKPGATLDGKPGEEKVQVERLPETTATFKTDDYEATWSSRSGALSKFVLADYQQRVEGKKLDEAGPENLVSSKAEKHHPFSIRFRSEKTDFSLPEAVDYTLVDSTDDRVVFRYTDPSDDKIPTITKTYTVNKEKYVIDLEVELDNRSEESLSEQILLDTFAGYKVVQSSGCMGCGGATTAPRTPVCLANEELEDLEPKAGTAKSREPNVLWTGINDQYFLSAMIPMGVDRAVCKMEARNDGVLMASLMYPEAVIPPGGSIKHRYRLFIGPKRLDIVEKVQGGAGQEGGDARLKESVDFGWFSFLVHPMLWLLKAFFQLVGNWGVAIIFLTIVIKIVLLPLTQKSMKSMKEMAKLKPMMEDLKKKYGDDKQRLNQEMMSLYKVHKINPLGGCFPMLLQMPIWFALFQMLRSMVELYQTPFIPGWIDDLSFQDPYYILPLVLGAAMFLQQKLSPTSADTQQAKMMMYGMPIMFTVIMLNLPAGLVLYIFTNSTLSIGHQLLYNRMTGPKPTTNIKTKGKEAAAR